MYGHLERCRQLTEARAEFEWLHDGPQVVQQQAIRDFDQAMRNFFNGTHGLPKWRKARRNEGFRIAGKRGSREHSTWDVRRLNRKWGEVRIPKVGWVRFRWSCPVPAGAKSFRVNRDPAGRWHVVFASVPEAIPAPGSGGVVGVDRGIVITAALSDGRKLNCPQPGRKERARVRKHLRRASRAPRGSEQKAAEYAKVAKLRVREVDGRKDWVEKTSTMLAREYDVIRFEKLDIERMATSAKGTTEAPGRNVAQKAGLNKAILAQGWGALRRRTEDKAPGRVEDVPAPFTSQRCSACGHVDAKSRESQADFRCTSCGFTCNADVNAAQNVAAGHAGGTAPRKRASVREPQPETAGIPAHQGREDVNTRLTCSIVASVA
jgi:putative transposase